MGKITDLVKANEGKRVFVYLGSWETKERFERLATAEGYTFGDGELLSERQMSDVMIVNNNRTISFALTAGRMAFGANSPDIIRVDFAKYIKGEKNYLYKKEDE